MSDQPQDYPAPSGWMVKAAEEIDIKLGLPRSDLAIDWCARIIAQHHLQSLDLAQLVQENAAAERAKMVALASREIVDALVEETRRNANAPSRSNMEQAVAVLAGTERGRASLQEVLGLLDGEASGLDYQGQNAVMTLLQAAWGPFGGSTRDSIRDALHQSA